MKLLGWMHRKFRQNSNEPLKDLVIGQSCACLTGQPSLEDQQFHSKPNSGNKYLWQPQREKIRNSFAGLEAARIEEDCEDESSELFHGFLAIGTLGSDPSITDPPTPVFDVAVENITEKETVITENELKLINEELEKVLGPEAIEDGSNTASGRNSHVSTGRSSHVSTGRSSHGSTITLSGKPVEGSDGTGSGTMTCPLQGYLFGSAIELSETTTLARKEHRTSLGELFQKAKISEESSGGKYEKEDKRVDKEGDKSAVHLIKKMLKKKMLNASRTSTAVSGGNVDTVAAETKSQKILKMFHRKVHPESLTTTQKHAKPQKNKIKRTASYYDGRYNNGGQMPIDEGMLTSAETAFFSWENAGCYKSQPNPAQSTISCGDSNGNRECWIKTDADYLVLEL